VACGHATNIDESLILNLHYQATL